MKKSVVLLAMMLASCDRLGISTDATDTISLLKTSSPKACSARDVQESLFQMIRPKEDEIAYSGDKPELFREAQTQVTYGLELVTLAKVDKDVSSVTCDANLAMTKLPNQKRTFRLTYEIRPSVQDPSQFVISANTNEAKQAANDAVTIAISKLVLAAAPPSAETPTENSQTLEVANLGEVANGSDSTVPAGSESNVSDQPGSLPPM